MVANVVDYGSKNISWGLGGEYQNILNPADSTYIRHPVDHPWNRIGLQEPFQFSGV